MAEKLGDLSGFLYLILKHRKFLIWNTVVVSSLVLAGSFLLPVRYRATATILPPEKDNKDVLGLGSVLQSFDVSKITLTGVSSNAQIYLAVLKSRTVADSMIDQFHLLERYKARNPEVARRRLGSASAFKLTSNGLIQVSVEDQQPQTAADMANAYVQYLDQLNRTLRMGEGRQTRIFVEDRLKATEARLRSAEDSLLAFKEKHPGIVLPDNVVASETATAGLLAQRITIGAELDELRAWFLPSAPMLVQKERAVTAFDRQLGNLPVLELELGRLFRNFKIQEKVYELLTSQFEEARIRENRDVATVEVLDSAIAPLRKSFPHRGFMTMAACLFSMVAGVLLVVCMESLGRMKLARDPRIRSVVRPGSLLDRVLFGQTRLEETQLLREHPLKRDHVAGS